MTLPAAKMTTELRAQIEELHNLAELHNEIEFAHMCVAALVEEQWAVDRMTAILAEIAKYGNPEKAKLFAVRNANASRTDGAIARKVEV